MNTTTKLLTTLALLATSTATLAHTGHGTHAEASFMSGLLHPILGLDHLLAMAAIGFWSVRQSSTMKNITPVFVVGGMILGASIAFAGIAMPGIETGIVLSVIVAGILIAVMAKLPTAAGGTLVVAFMVIHGFAHGAEMPAGASLAAYLVGFSVATLAITLFGRAFGTLVATQYSRVGRVVGGVIALSGAILQAF